MDKTFLVATIDGVAANNAPIFSPPKLSTTWQPPSPTKLTPRKLFTNALNTRKARAWERQPRTTSTGDGKARTVWKRFEGDAELDKENMPLEEEDLLKEKGGKIGSRHGSPKKAVKKICLMGDDGSERREGVGRVWERRASGLMHKVAQAPTNKLQIVVMKEEVSHSVVPSSTSLHDESVAGPVTDLVAEQSSLPDNNDIITPTIITEHPNTILNEDIIDTAENLSIIELTSAGTMGQSLACCQCQNDDEMAVSLLPSNEDGTTDTPRDSAESQECLLPNNEDDTTHATRDSMNYRMPELAPAQVWTRSKSGLRDDTARARGEICTPKANFSAKKRSMSPGAQLDEITPSFLKRMFTVLNDAKNTTPRSAAVASPSGQRESSRPCVEAPEASLIVADEVCSSNEFDLPAKGDMLFAVDGIEDLESSARGSEITSRSPDSTPQEPMPMPQAPPRNDTQLLLDFLNRAEANKAKRALTIAKRSSLSNRRDSGVIRAALASPTKTACDRKPDQPLSAENAAAILEMTESDFIEATCSIADVEAGLIIDSVEATSDEQTEPSDEPTRGRSRRSTRIPKQAKNLLVDAPNAITLHRTDGQEPRVLKDAEARQLLATTRANTRRNKGGAVYVPQMLIKLKAATTDAVEEVELEAERSLTIRWKDELAEYCEIDAREVIAECSDKAEEEVPAVQESVPALQAKAIPRPRKIAKPSSSKPKTSKSKEVQVHDNGVILVPIEQSTNKASTSKEAPAVKAVPRRLPQPVRGRGKFTAVSTPRQKKEIVVVGTVKVGGNGVGTEAKEDKDKDKDNNVNIGMENKPMDRRGRGRQPGASGRHKENR